MMKKCRLTILKTTLQEDLAKEYGIPNLSAPTKTIRARNKTL